MRILGLMTAVFVSCPRECLAVRGNYSGTYLNGHASKDIIVYKSLEIKIMSQMINSSADPTCQLKKKMTHLYAIGAHDKTKVMLKSVIWQTPNHMAHWATSKAKTLANRNLSTLHGHFSPSKNNFVPQYCSNSCSTKIFHFSNKRASFEERRMWTNSICLYTATVQRANEMLSQWTTCTTKALIDETTTCSSLISRT